VRANLPGEFQETWDKFKPNLDCPGSFAEEKAVEFFETSLSFKSHGKLKRLGREPRTELRMINRLLHICSKKFDEVVVA
jgi:hypothetical protein